MPARAQHARTEYGANTDMRVDYPRANLDDPGAGLRGRAWRVLTLADLRTPGGDPDPREPEREIELHLTGNMGRFVWSLDGIKPIGRASGRDSVCQYVMISGVAVSYKKKTN